MNVMKLNAIKVKTVMLLYVNYNYSNSLPETVEVRQAPSILAIKKLQYYSNSDVLYYSYCVLAQLL